MKTSTMLGIGFLGLALGLAAFEPFLMKMAATPSSPASKPNSLALSSEVPSALPIEAPASPETGILRPRHEPLAHRHSQHAGRARGKKQGPHEKAAAGANAAQAPLTAPTFFPSTPEPRPVAAVEVVSPPPTVPVQILHHMPLVAATERPVFKSEPLEDTPAPPPPTFSPRDLARQRKLERLALIDAAQRAARGTVLRTVAHAHVLSAEATDHGRWLGVVVVEQRANTTVVENFVFTPGPNGLGLSERRVISQSYTDPFVAH